MHPINPIRLARICLALIGGSGALAQTKHPDTYSGAAAQAATPVVQHEFVYRSSTALNSVSVAGTFNKWDRNANQLTPDTDGKTWRTTLRLPMGKYLYKFVVNGSTWVTDPTADKTQTDGMGNSPLSILPADYGRLASPRDGVTAVSALLHPTSVPYLNYDRGKLTLSLRARPNDLARITLKLGNRRYPMTVVTSDDLYAFYSTRLDWDRRNNLTYDFELVDGDKTLEFGANGLWPPAVVKPFQLDTTKFKPFVVPDWVERSVLYQIFADRFADGDKSNDPPEVRPWNAPPTGSSRFGGDVQGIAQHLPYLTDLGISAVYFTPVYKSPSNHRYDVEDYKSVDPQFGTNAEFAGLTRDLQSKGIRTVMDFVFNHSSSTFSPFVDVIRNGQDSVYKNWYFIGSFPVRMQRHPNYAAFGDWWGMPKLNEANPATRDYMLNVVDFWKKEVPLSGLRLDVADQIDVGFLRELRQRVKELDPQMWIVGETWGDASPWLEGDQWDAAMNYPFLFANVDFFAEGKTSPSAFAARLMENYRNYAPQVSRNMMNSLSTHDTPRFLTRCHNDNELDELAATVQFTWVGAPCIYYGDELGMQGGADPDNRRGMAWNLANQDNPMLLFYKRLIQMRRKSKCLQSGEPAILLTDDRSRTLAYSRTIGDEVAIIAVNRSEKPQTVTVTLPDNSATRAVRRTGFVDGLSGRKFALGAARSLSIPLPPLRAAILVSTAENLAIDQAKRASTTRHNYHMRVELSQRATIRAATAAPSQALNGSARLLPSMESDSITGLRLLSRAGR